MFEVAKKIESEINELFPYVNTEVQEWEESGEFCITIDDRKVYDSPEFIAFFGKKEDELFDKGIFNIIFGCEKRAENLTIYAGEIEKTPFKNIAFDIDYKNVELSSIENIEYNSYGNTEISNNLIKAA